MSSSVIDEVRAVVPAGAKLSARGFLNFNCPACGDKRGRGGIHFTATGGFRYRCFNGGCDFEKATGFEPGNGFGGRPRKIFELMGGDVRRIPLDELLKWQRCIFLNNGEVSGKEQDLEVEYKFPTVDLPEGAVLLYEAAKKNKAANKVFRELAKKDPVNIDRFPYMWAPGELSYYYIIPFFHYHDQVVGYVGRHIYRKTGEKRFIGRAPSDYMFNQHIITGKRGKYLIVVESPLDAIALNCVAARGSRLTQKQVNLLKVSGKEIVLLPDLVKEEWRWFLDTARDNDWLISCPEFTGHETDTMRSVVKNGLLLTIEQILKGIAKPEQAELHIKMQRQQ